MIDPDGRSALAGNASGYRSAEDIFSEAAEKRVAMILEGLRNQQKNTLRQIAKMGKKAMRSWSSEQWSAVSEVFEENGVSNVNKRTFKRAYRKAVKKMEYDNLMKPYKPGEEPAYGEHIGGFISLDNRIHHIVQTVNLSIKSGEPVHLLSGSGISEEFKSEFLKEEQKRSTNFILGVLFHEVAHYVAWDNNITDAHVGSENNEPERGFLFEQKVLGYEQEGGITRHSPEAGYLVWRMYDSRLSNASASVDPQILKDRFKVIYPNSFGNSSKK